MAFFLVTFGGFSWQHLRFSTILKVIRELQNSIYLMVPTYGEESSHLCPPRWTWPRPSAAQRRPPDARCRPPSAAARGPATKVIQQLNQIKYARRSCLLVRRVWCGPSVEELPDDGGVAGDGGVVQRRHPELVGAVRVRVEVNQHLREINM